MRWWRKVSRTDKGPDRFAESPEQRRIRTISKCEVLLQSIGEAYETVEAASADLAGTPEKTLEAWAHEVLEDAWMVAYEARDVNLAAPAGHQLPYHYLNRVRSKLATRKAPDAVRIAQLAAYQEALTTLRRDTERLRATLTAENNEMPKRA
ncbi:hypothetical protein [Actinocrispum sp. NPDC049592]|uniref:hypothetical protein n=1 Tax=Actinocrispum sp. NPDC049592 TaxID=3154835 RepID=UPI0034441C19